MGFNIMRKAALILLCLTFFSSAYAQDDETNDQNGDLNTNTQDSTVNSNNTTTSNSQTTQNVGAGAGSPTPPPTAISPSLMSSGNDTCLKSKSVALQMDILGLSGGGYKQDEECNRRKDAKVLKDLGMSIAAVARMCQNLENWKAMFSAGTPCPVLVNGKMIFGKNALIAMKRRPELYIPDYNEKTKFGKLKNQETYNSLLGIGVTIDEEETIDGGGLSVSERFRTKSD
jgi:hypothetical protein